MILTIQPRGRTNTTALCPDCRGEYHLGRHECDTCEWTGFVFIDRPPDDAVGPHVIAKEKMA